MAAGLSGDIPDGSVDVLTQDEIWHVRTLTLDGLHGWAESHCVCA
ncbi:hypothetical protein ACLB1T_32240 [Escherichia coli]